MLEIVYTSAFKRDFKKISRNPKATKALKDVLELLVNEQPLPEKNRPHPLRGDYADVMECHILPDLLLFYRIKNAELTLVLIRLGTHSGLF